MEKNPKSRRHPKMPRRNRKSNPATAPRDMGGTGPSQALRKSFERSRIDESGAEIER
jgi:hypothetical protein